MNFEAVIGLEVHIRLLTRTKIFCACAVEYGAAPNTQTCPVCLGLPGALPVLNRRAVEFAIRAASALGCEVHHESAFARKSYFYPDLPKGYQITQYDRPLASGGALELDVGNAMRRIGITRLHLEEDAGKSIHDAARGRSLVDFNRAGAPLCELVTAPDLRSPAEAAAFLKAVRQILMYLEVCDGNMEQGSFRCDANVSIRSVGSTAPGTRTELKNMNSFRHIEHALKHEIDRQISVCESGGSVAAETRAYDPGTDTTRPLRAKEDADDYRYFPEPDLQVLRVPDAWIVEIRETQPELPRARRTRLMAEHRLSAHDAGVLTADKALADYFEDCVKLWRDPKAIANWIMTELLREMRRDDIPLSKCPVTPNNLVSLLKLTVRGEISHTMAKEIFVEMYKSGRDAPAIVKDLGAAQLSDTAGLERTIGEIVASHPAEAARYLAGNRNVLDFFMGALMKATKGRANPGLAREILERKLSK